MKKMISVMTAMLLFTAGTTGMMPVPGVFSSPEVSVVTADSGYSGYADQIAALVNQERAKYGLSPLYCSVKLNQIAEMRSEELETLYSHTRPDGSMCYEALYGVVSYQTFSENIAKNQTSPEEVMKAWMNSEAHRANILDSEFEFIGVGVYQDASGGYYFTQIFTSGSLLTDTYLPELSDSNTEPDPEPASTTAPVSYGGTVHFSYSDLDLKKDDIFFLYIVGDPGDVVKISLYYTDENGNRKTVTLGGLEGATLSSNGNLTEAFIVPCNVNSLSGKVVYEKSEPELSYGSAKVPAEEPEETTTQVTTTATTATTTAMTTTTTTSAIMTTASTKATTTTSVMTTAPRPTLQITETKVILQPGDQYQIQANQTGLRYRTSSEEVAIVSKSGVITAIDPGTARITVYNSDYDAVVMQVTVTEEVQATLRGDADGDGTVGVSDVVMMNRVYVGIEQISVQALANVDTDGDGKITLADSMNLLRYLVHLTDEF